MALLLLLLLLLYRRTYVPATLTPTSPKCPWCLPTSNRCRITAAAAAAIQAHLRASNFDPYKSEVPMLPAHITPTPTLVTLPDTEQVGGAPHSAHVQIPSVAACCDMFGAML
jgi:hypothetical protein